MASDTTQSEPAVNLEKVLRFAYGTDVGRRREENQDFYGVVENSNYKFYMVADGMGGANGGATASHMAIEVVSEYLKDQKTIDDDILSLAIQRSNSRIFEAGASDDSLSGMGTTFVGLAFQASQMYIASVGDSRAYRFRNGAVEQLTEDHTLVMELLRSGAITIDQADSHPVAHMLTRSLGPTPEVVVDCFLCTDGPLPGDKYLMCSDGLYNLVDSNEMLQILEEKDLDEAVKALIDLANDRGGTDNITVMIIEVGADFRPSPILLTESALEKTEAPLVNTQAQSTDTNVTPASNTEAVEAKPVVEKLEVPEAKPSKPKPVTRNSAARRSPQPGFRLEIRSEKRFSQKARNYAGVTVFGVVMVVVGLYVGYRHGLPSEQVASVRPDVSVEQTRQRSTDSEDVRVNTDRYSTDAPDVNHPPGEESRSQTNGLGHSVPLEGRHRLTGQEIEEVIKRKQELRSYLGDLEEKLNLFDKPFSDATLKTLKDSEYQTGQLRSQIEQIRTDLDVATRKLAVWFGRRQKLAVSDPVDLAAEVAVTVDSVRKKKEEFEVASWAYLKEVEVWRYNPNDQALTDSLKQLGRQRDIKKRELATMVREQVERQVASSDQLIAELTARRDDLNSALDSASNNASFIKILTGNNERAKFEKKQEILKEREMSMTELNELNRLVSEDQEQLSHSNSAVEVRPQKD